MSDQRYKIAKIYISLKHGKTITKELHTQFKEGRNCDLEIRLDKKRLYVHKCLIDIFFIKAGAELEDDKFFLDLTRYSQSVVEALIGLVYTGNLCCSLDQVENVYKAAAELGCVEAQDGCQTYLRENGIPEVVFPVSSGPSSKKKTPQNPVADTTDYSLDPDPDSNIIVKTEPVDDYDNSQNTDHFDPVEETHTGIGRYDYKSTLLVPVTGPNAGMPLLPYQSGMNTLAGLNMQTAPSSRVSVSNEESCPGLPAPRKYKLTSKAQTKVKASPRKREANKTKVTVLGKDKKMKKTSVLRAEENMIKTANCTKSGSMLKQTETETHSFSTTTESDDARDSSAKKAGKRGMIECRTKSGTVYYKFTDSASFNQDELSLDTDSRESSSSRSTKDRSAEPEIQASDDIKSNIEETPSVEIKVEIDSMDNLEANSIDALKNEQMFSLGLTKTSNIKLNTSEESVNSGKKRRLRTRKKMDYSYMNIDRDDFDSGSDYDPGDLRGPKKRFKRHSTTPLGTNLKIDSSNLVRIDPWLQADGESESFKSPNASRSIDQSGSKTIAIRQDYHSEINNDGLEGAEHVYFPPAGSVPEGVRSQYAKGTYFKVKYMTETRTDTDGNVTVISKRVPVRPRQYGLDERLKNRPSVYVCHPTAPVVKTVVRKSKS